MSKRLRQRLSRPSFRVAYKLPGPPPPRVSPPMKTKITMVAAVVAAAASCLVALKLWGSPPVARWVPAGDGRTVIDRETGELWRIIDLASKQRREREEREEREAAAAAAAARRAPDAKLDTEAMRRSGSVLSD